MTLTFNKVGAPRGTKHIGSARGIVGTGGAGAGLLVASLILAGCALPSMGGLWGEDDELVEDPTVARAESTAAADDVPGQSLPKQSGAPLSTMVLNAYAPSQRLRPMRSSIQRMSSLK